LPHRHIHRNTFLEIFAVKNQLTRVVLILAAVVLSVYFLWPTYQDYTFRTQLANLRGQDSVSFVEQNQDAILNARMKRVKLGLDLQGGMRVVIEVDILQLLDDLAKNKDGNFATIMQEVRAQASTKEVAIIPLFTKQFMDRGIRLSRYYLSVRDDDKRISSYLVDESEKAIDRAIEIVRNRVDQYRVSEPTIQKQGGRRIIVELPGVKDESEVRQLLQGTAKLEFKLLKDPQIAYRVMESIDKFLTGTLEADTTSGTKTAAKKDVQPKQNSALSDLTGGNAPATSDTTSEAKFIREHPFFAYVRPDQRGSGEGYVEEKDKDRVIRLLERPEIKRLLPPDLQFTWSAKSQAMADGKKYFLLYPVRQTAEITGGVVVNAQASVDPEDNRPIVNMEMNSEGSRDWARITGANVGKRIAIMLDNAIFSAPVVQTKITGGRSRITGMETPNEARLLEIVLKAGALPAPVTIIEHRSVGPSLGEDSIRSGMSAAIWALIVTIVFMALYYNTAGLVADLALAFNMLFILGVMAGFQATLTLPGIAGVVLTIGMAVDANVLINERIREELAGGKTLRAAIDAGYEKAFSAILDSNVTTFLTGVILYQFGTGSIQGFALTLMIGIVATMFSAVIITRVVFNAVTDKGLTPHFG
jgi:SecD/SecF fusion protein